MTNIKLIGWRFEKFQLVFSWIYLDKDMQAAELVQFKFVQLNLDKDMQAEELVQFKFVQLDLDKDLQAAELVFNSEDGSKDKGRFIYR